ncbi:MAG: M28 family peptidase [Gemmatimonadota bacterium]
MKFLSYSRFAGLLLPVACFACTPAQNQPSGFPSPSASDPTTPAISEADLRIRVYLIADDSMGGRPTGSVGHIKVTEYIGGELKRFGLQPAGDNGTYFQNVPFVRRRTDTQLNVDGAALQIGQDYNVLLAGVIYPAIQDAQVIYGGVAADSATWISAEQARGKFVILSQTPGRYQVTTQQTNHPRFREAVAVAHTNYAGVWPQLEPYLRPGPMLKPADAPPVTQTRPATLFLSDPVAERLLGVALAQATAGTIGKNVTGRVAFTEEQLIARNVVAVLPGSDAMLRGQYVAVSAHLDHDPIAPRAVDHDSLRTFNTAARKLQLDLGRDPTPQDLAAIKVNVDSLRRLRPARRDSILNGADDDASGTSAVLEIAEALAASRNKPKRSTLFVWHVAEELGLVGARYFTDNPTVPRDSIIADLNIDMIGRGGPGEEPAGGPDYLQLIGWRKLSTELGDLTETVNRERRQPFKFDLSYDTPGHPEQYYCRSDHYMYARYGIPVVFFSTGSHGDYHQVTDEPQYIDYSKLMNVTQLIHDIALRVANLEHRVVVDKPKPDPRAQCRQ